MQGALRRRVDEQDFRVVETMRGHEVTREMNGAREVFQVKAIELQTDGTPRAQRLFDRLSTPSP